MHEGLRSLRVLRAVCVWLGVGDMACLLGLWSYWNIALPEHPDVKLGRTWELSTHGHLVYMTQGQGVTLTVLGWMFAVLFAGAAWCDLVERRRSTILGKLLE
jgi:hypothetical protein